MSKSFFVLISFLVFQSIQSHAQTDSVEIDSIDLELRNCLDEHFSSYDLISCMDDARMAWDNELNIVYKKLLTELSTEEQVLLKESQRQWIIYRDKEMAFVRAYNDHPGSSYNFSIIQREMELTRARTIELRGYCGGC